MEFIIEHSLGNIVNFAVVLIAGILGTLIKVGIPKRFTDIVMSGMAICVIYIGIDGILAPAPAVNESSFLSAGLFKVLVMIISMAVGTVIGELIDFDKLLKKLGDKLGSIFKGMFKKKDEAESGEDVGAKFAEGFVSCSLLFCVGAMAINGAIADASGDPGILLAKSVIDGISCFVMATTLGIGCAFSAFMVLIYQGIFNLLGIFLTTALGAGTIAYMSFTGSLIIILIGTNVLGITKVKTANMVPAMFVAIGVEALMRLIFGA